MGRAQRGPNICNGLSTRRPSTAHWAPPTQHRWVGAALQPQTWVLSWTGHGHPPASDLGALLDRPTAALLGVPTDLGHSPGRAHGHLLGGRRETWANGLRAQAALKRSINVLGLTGYVSMELICQELSSLKELLRHQWGPGLQAGWGERREGTQVKLLRRPTCDSLVTFLSLNSTGNKDMG